MNQNEKRLLRIPAVARILDLPEQRIYELARQGILPHVRLGRQIRIDSEQLELFIKNGGRALPGGWRKEA